MGYLKKDCVSDAEHSEGVETKKTYSQAMKTNIKDVNKNKLSPIKTEEDIVVDEHMSDINWEKSTRRKKKKNVKVIVKHDNKNFVFQEPLLVDLVIDKANNVNEKLERTIEDKELVDVTECTERQFKMKTKKKKKSSDSTQVPRIIIRDDKMDWTQLKISQREDKCLLMNNFEFSSPSADLLIVHELGLGMARGSMSNGRLYRSKYIPPDRVSAFKEEVIDNKNQIDLD